MKIISGGQTGVDRAALDADLEALRDHMYQFATVIVDGFIEIQMKKRREAMIKSKQFDVASDPKMSREESSTAASAR